MSQHEAFIRESIALADSAVANGNHPFGALLVKDDAVLLQAENTIYTENDITNHAETNLVRMAVRQYDADFLADCILYTSTEPCAMCSGAIYWSGIGQVVYGCSEERLYEISGGGLFVPCRKIFENDSRKVTVIGPLLEDEAVQPHLKYWT